MSFLGLADVPYCIHKSRFTCAPTNDTLQLTSYHSCAFPLTNIKGAMKNMHLLLTHASKAATMPELLGAGLDSFLAYGLLTRHRRMQCMLSSKHKAHRHPIDCMYLSRVQISTRKHVRGDTE